MARSQRTSQDQGNVLKSNLPAHGPSLTGFTAARTDVIHSLTARRYCSALDVNIPHVILIDKIAAKLQRLVPYKTHNAATAKPAPDTTAQQLEKLYEQLSRLEDAYWTGQWELPRYTECKKQIDTEIREERERQANAELDLVTRQQYNLALQEFISIPDLPNWLQTSDPAEVNQHLHFLIDHICISEEKIEIRLNRRSRLSKAASLQHPASLDHFKDGYD